MNKSQTCEYLEQKNIPFELTEHEAVFTMDELQSVNIPYPDRDAKNLFVRDDKKKNYYLITVRGDKRVDLKEFRRNHGLRPLSFASAEDLFSILGLTPGSVTPLGILNDNEAKVKVFIDEEFLDGNGLCGVHPNNNTATLWLKTTDLIAIIKEHGNDVETMRLIN